MSFLGSLPDFEIRPATIDDVPLILCFIKKLAHYERLAHEVVATEESLRETLFSSGKTAEVAIGFSRAHRSAWCCSSTTIRLSWAGQGSTLRISSSMNHTVGGDSGQRYCAT